MPRSRLYATLATAAIALGAQACSDAGTTPGAGAADAELSADVAVGDAATMEGDLDLLSGAAALARASAAVGDGVRTSLSGDCATVACDNLAVNRTYKYFDAAGAEQGAFNPATTAVVQLTASVTGTIDRPKFTGTVSRKRVVKMTRPTATAAERVWTGTGSRSEQWESTAGAVARSYTLTAVDSVRGVTITVPRSLNPYPTAGTIVHNLAVKQTRDGATTANRGVTRRVTATFDGTHLVQLQVGTNRCTLDLDKAAGERVSCE
jgi:hypothetical protein